MLSYESAEVQGRFTARSTPNTHSPLIVKSPFNVTMGSEGVVIEPASENDNYLDGHGHHHIVVDAPLPNLDQPIPQESIQHLHFGKGQLETVLDLEPGKHTLRLLFAKGDHVPWDPAVTETIEITVID